MPWWLCWLWFLWWLRSLRAHEMSFLKLYLSKLYFSKLYFSKQYFPNCIFKCIQLQYVQNTLFAFFSEVPDICKYVNVSIFRVFLPPREICKSLNVPRVLFLQRELGVINCTRASKPLCSLHIWYATTYENIQILTFGVPNQGLGSWLPNSTYLHLDFYLLSWPFFVLFFAFSPTICMWNALFAKIISPFDLLLP